MSLLQETLAAIVPVDDTLLAEAQRRLDNKTKPQGSLGRLEEFACRMAAITGSLEPDTDRKVIFTFAGDHGIVEEGVSAFPKEVKELDKQQVKLFGFMMPLDQAKKQKRFLLSAFPPHCSFCLTAGPESLVEVLADKPVDFTFEPERFGSGPEPESWRLGTGEVVVIGSREAVDGRGDDIIEVGERPCLAEQGAFVGHLGSTRLDAACLLMPLVRAAARRPGEPASSGSGRL